MSHDVRREAYSDRMYQAASSLDTVLQQGFYKKFGETIHPRFAVRVYYDIYPFRDPSKTFEITPY
jgi:hypothetical protein